MRYERHIVQYLPECAEFDPQLAYRLKPGRCRFHNREYDHEIVVNSAGMRDREEALDGAADRRRGRLVRDGLGRGAVGDRAAAVLGELTGEKTLERRRALATARRARCCCCARSTSPAAHTLVIQYCENDFIENARFVRADGRLPTMAAARVRARSSRDHLADDALLARASTCGDVLPLLWWAARGGDGSPTGCATAPSRRACSCDVLAPRFEPARRPLRVIVFEAMYTRRRSARASARSSRELARAARSCRPGSSELPGDRPDARS